MMVTQPLMEIIVTVLEVFVRLSEAESPNNGAD